MQAKPMESEMKTVITD